MHSRLCRHVTKHCGWGRATGVGAGEGMGIAGNVPEPSDGGKASISLHTYTRIDSVPDTLSQTRGRIGIEVMSYQSEPLTIWIDRRLVLRKSAIQGLGTFTIAPIPAGQLLILTTGGLVLTAQVRQSGELQLEAEMYKGFEAQWNEK
jgi:hypothetical protein